jgi:hypothetical protein
MGSWQLMKYITKTLLLSFIFSSLFTSASLYYAGSLLNDAGVKGSRYQNAVGYYQDSDFDFIFNNPSQAQLDSSFNSSNGVESFFPIYRERSTFTTIGESFRADLLFSDQFDISATSPFNAERLIQGNQLLTNRVYVDEVMFEKSKVSVGDTLSITLDLEVSFSLVIGGVFPKDPYYDDGIAYFVKEGAIDTLIHQKYTEPFEITKLKYGKVFVKGDNPLMTSFRNSYAPEGRMLGPDSFFTTLEYTSYVNDFRSKEYPFDVISAASELLYNTEFYKPSFDEALSTGTNQYILFSLVFTFLSMIVAKVLSKSLLRSGGKYLLIKLNYILHSFSVFFGSVIALTLFSLTHFFLFESYSVKSLITNQINSYLFILIVLVISTLILILITDKPFNIHHRSSILGEILSQKVPSDFAFKDLTKEISPKDTEAKKPTKK